MLISFWDEFKALMPETQALDFDEASGTAVLLMGDGLELLAEWDERCLWLSALLGVPPPHQTLEVYDTLLAFVANRRESGGLTVAGAGGGESLALIARVLGSPQALTAGDLAQAIARFSSVVERLKRYVAAPGTHHLGRY